MTKKVDIDYIMRLKPGPGEGIDLDLIPVKVRAGLATEWADNREEAVELCNLRNGD